MEFEEFFKKKKIDLPVLEKAEPVLFSEFKTHYGQMGEKSFDHTKKYWFNKLRRQFPLAPEVKTEKPHIANPIAEQTVTESLIETVMPPAPKAGFTPRFKAGVTAKPVEITDDKKAIDLPAGNAEGVVKEQPSAAPAPKVGFTPRFKAGVTSKPVEPPTDKKEEDLTNADNAIKDQSVETATTAPSPKVGFTPRFKVGTTPKQAENTADKKEDILPAASEESIKEVNADENTGSKPAAYKPRFKMKPKTDGE